MDIEPSKHYYGAYVAIDLAVLKEVESMHPDLKEYSKTAHIKLLNKQLERIEKDLKKREAGELVVKILNPQPQQSLAERFGGLFRIVENDDMDQSLLVSTTIPNDCLVEVMVPVRKNGYSQIYQVIIDLPVPMRGRAVYHKTALGAKWEFSPTDKKRCSDLKKALPKTKMMSTPDSSGRYFEIQEGHALESNMRGGTTWIITSAHESGFKSNLPNVGKYVEAAPKLLEILKRWNQDGGA